MIKKILIGIIVLVVVVLGIRFFTAEGNWICVNGEWIKHGNPKTSQPDTPCFVGIPEGLSIISPKSNAEIKSPVVVKGYVNGNGWTGFEAQAGNVRILDESGNVLAVTPLTLKTDWTKLPAYFEVEMNFVNSASGTGSMVFSNENPSGMSDKDKEVVWPVTFGVPPATSEVKAYFLNDKLDSKISCDNVFPITRKIIKTTAVAQAALIELLSGPTMAENSNGYYTLINSDVKINSLSIKDGVAYVDFDETLQEGVGGSCKVAAIRNQIVNTLKQFSTVKDVVISINGDSEKILQP